ncbi:glutathione S-transferase family protein [Algiphilus aromaticivorans]|uniref:glutathione S-transferase family protein n=1 Tax=Algiphilus aromaticivorans TaxID=382454 RepID=UPI0005C21212|nr:glutathione S-transferase family protein [Algiphilus aromaticivorans]
MGRLVDGVWYDEWYDTESTGGAFRREDAGFRHWVTADGSPGPSGEGGFAAESGRYHLYVSMACPWAHRTLIFRKIKALEPHIGVTVVHPHMLSNGWEYRPEPEPLHGYHFHYQLYTHVKPDYSGRVTVPVLWDKQRDTIVSNESAEIIRMFNSAFDDITGNRDDYYPEALRGDIDSINGLVYDSVNNGVYRCGFATTQEAYEKPFHELFGALDELEARLQAQRWLCGEHLTEADWRLFTTLMRFDAVYYGHFKCNKRRIRDYPALYRYLHALLAVPGVSETVDLEQCKQHYYYSHATINPTRVVPLGPDPLV